MVQRRLIMPMMDGAPFMAKLEQAERDGDFEFVFANVLNLERMRQAFEQRIEELRRAERRAQGILDRQAKRGRPKP